jgi:hypothetical protein
MREANRKTQSMTLIERQKSRFLSALRQLKQLASELTGHLPPPT